MNKYEAFLKDLTELSEKHGVIIGGCGCCGSPRLEEFDDINEDHPFEVTGGWYEVDDYDTPDCLRWVNNDEVQAKIDAANEAHRQKALARLEIEAEELRQAQEKLRAALNGR